MAQETRTTDRRLSRKRGRRLLLLFVVFLLLGAWLGGQHLWAYWHYREAQKALGTRDFAAAEQHFEESLRVWSSSSETHLQAARAARKAGDFDTAERLLARCRDLGGEADAILLELQLAQVQRGHLMDVEPQLVDRVLHNHPESVAILEVLTLASIQTFRLAHALECLRRWLEREPNRVEAWLLQAYVYDRLRNPSQALASYRRAVELDPVNDEARVHMAVQLAGGNYVEEAFAQFQYLREKQGDTPTVLTGLAYCHRMRNEPQEARQLLEAVLADHPRDWKALAERGRLAMEEESPQEAEKWLRQAVTIAPHESEISYSLCQCLRRLGKNKEAEEVLAALKSVEKDLEHMAELSRQIARSPHDPALRCEAGLLLIRNGLDSEGLRWLESALAEDPRHKPTHLALADFYARQGEKEKADQHREMTKKK
jgi:Tfp pilus assembly protein PilF